MTLAIDVWAQTDVGHRREINQDSILVDNDLNLFVVADGMGGHRGGEVASAMAVETVQEIIQQGINSNRTSLKRLLCDSYREASQRIHNRSTTESPELLGMGTTMVGVLIADSTAFIANVGDSRAYLYRKSCLWLVTEDHSLVNEQVRAGVLREDEAHLVIGRNVITRSIGFEREVEVDAYERVLIPGDVILLCSDGLSSMIDDQEILRILEETPLDKAAARCIAAAKRAGGDDNVSVILLKAQDG